MENKYLSRKFGLSAGLLISYLVLLTCNILSQEVYQYLTLGTLGLDLTGNVTQDFRQRPKSSRGVAVDRVA